MKDLVVLSGYLSDLLSVQSTRLKIMQFAHARDYSGVSNKLQEESLREINDLKEKVKTTEETLLGVKRVFDSRDNFSESEILHQIVGLLSKPGFYNYCSTRESEIN